MIWSKLKFILILSVVSVAAYNITIYADESDADIQVDDYKGNCIEIVNYQGNKSLESTQLVQDKYNADADNQLLLDSVYYVKWDNYAWALLTGDNTLEEDMQKFDTLITAKYLRFPFDIMYENTIYSLDASTGYTEWINITEPEDRQTLWGDGADINKYQSSNHWQMTPFYIPCFAQEGGSPEHPIFVEAKIIMRSEPSDEPEDEELLNPDEMTNEIEGDEEGLSPLPETEINTKIQVQLSGWLFGLSLVGTDNGLVYNGKGLLSGQQTPLSSLYAMASAKAEIKSGVRSRLGTENLRYLRDGSVNSSYPLQLTLPLRNGSSLSFPSMGAAWKGQETAFIVKTMANLDGDNDYIEIVPQLYYQLATGEVLSYGEFKLYVTDTMGNWRGMDYNPANWDISEKTPVTLGDPLFKHSFHNSVDTNGMQSANWAQTTLEIENQNRHTLGIDPLSMQMFLNRKIPSYSLSHISVPPMLRLFAGEYGQLAMNDGHIYDSDTDAGDLKDYCSWINYDENITGSKVLRSMQQWHFKYSIPTHIKIVDVREKGGLNFDLAEYVGSKEQWWWESDPDVYTDNGFLLIRFQIMAYKNGEPYLSYCSDDPSWLSLDMWEQEGFTSEYPHGTVIVVDMSKSINDYFVPAIQNIN